MMAQEVLNGSNGKTVFLLFILKALVVLITLWAGAYGGTLTPSFALGMAGSALFGMILGGDSQPSILLLGSVCFLSVTLRAPWSATGLVLQHGVWQIDFICQTQLVRQLVRFLSVTMAKPTNRYHSWVLPSEAFR